MEETVRWCVDELRGGWMNVGLFTRWVLDFATPEDAALLAVALEDQPEAIASISQLALTPAADIIVTGPSPHDPASLRIQGFFAAWRAHFGLDSKQATCPPI